MATSGSDSERSRERLSEIVDEFTQALRLAYGEVELAENPDATAAPLLLVNTVADPATPYAGAVRAQQRLADARLITVEGWGHTSLAHPSGCVRQLTDRYLIEQVAPPDGQRCAPDADPFGATASLADVDDRAAILPLPPMGTPSSA